MDLLFKREQGYSGRSVKFKLWGKIQIDFDEADIMKKYKFTDAVLIDVDQPGLFGRSAFVSVVVFVIAFIAVRDMGVIGLLLAVAAGIGAGFFWYHQNRETIYVKDLLHGRHFTCDSVVDLARKEAWLETVVSYLRQVMESAKHWDGTEQHTVEPLPKEEARQVILKGI
ncbi:hypothetical protein [Roseovarius rhodophyticola]|uniref:DUF4231 domain-containing protein n=1 Tax=Roseovarius rhodophyticola TaxID=3080827 RepID=A0ABZ2TJW4_9RHOB|nr:hypothetical protein [Roseovarius sp. W115]MDV2930177.1 hypothetical protein [Roseovarius sp. W115]